MVFLRAVFDELFWRNYGLFYEREFEYLFVSLLWTGPYVVVCCFWFELPTILIVGVFLFIFGRI